MLISAVTGLGGIGKTALAIEAAHQACASGWFPGGTLFVDLRGYDENPVTADQAVLALLDALGVRDAELPTTTARQYDAYRARLCERRPRTLLILDNVSDPSQFLPLLPGTGHHRILITSRDRPDSLPLHVVSLENLPEDDSTALVRTALSNDPRDERPSLEPDALRELTVLCGHLPLALQIAAAMLRRRRHRLIASLVAEIRKAEDPTAVLDGGARGTDQYGRSLVLRPVLETSYRRLSPAQARLLRLLALIPGPDAATDAVAILADLGIDPVLDLLEDLAAAGLVTPVRGTGDAVRWRLHDLVRAFGAGLVATDGALGEEGEAARERILVYYAMLASAANARMEWQSGLEEDPGCFATRAEALAWLDGERAGLVAAVQWAGEERFETAAGALAASLGEYLHWRRYFDDWVAVARAAFHQTVCHLGRRELESVKWSRLGVALGEAGRVEEAVEALTRARDTFPAAGQPHEEATVWSNLGTALMLAGRTEEAIDAHTRARDLCRSARNNRGEAGAWSGLGNALRDADRMEEAVEALTRARDLLRTAGSPHEVAATCSNLGVTLHEAGRTQEAIEALTTSLGICREFEDWYHTGFVLEHLAWIHEHTDVPAQARIAFVQAADAYGRAGAPDDAARCRTWAEGLS
ncbi:tetratricopeptide repeat protein [Streptomyces sp. DT2A-34]|nr:tetratricopeptide repeat protein [Streptomyces sp. DT2A-34]MDO0911662.1 tetratricopeptide repeat protein [Streptomyces sp. DT2A-34]